MIILPKESFYYALMFKLSLYLFNKKYVILLVCTNITLKEHNDNVYSAELTRAQITVFAVIKLKECNYVWK